MKQKLNTEAGRDNNPLPLHPIPKNKTRSFTQKSGHTYCTKVRAEWKLICLTHNLLKLFRSGQAWQMS
jgi:hypothetical protein